MSKRPVWTWTDTVVGIPIHDYRSARRIQGMRPPDPKEPPPLRRKLRNAVLARDGHECRRCGGKNHLCADHIHPRRHGGPDTLENLQTLCIGCNTRKGSKIEAAA